MNTEDIIFIAIFVPSVIVLAWAIYGLVELKIASIKHQRKQVEL